MAKHTGSVVSKRGLVVAGPLLFGYRFVGY